MSDTDTTPAMKVLTEAQLAELLRLLPGSDSMELKLTVPERDQRSAIRALQLDPLEAQVRQVVFFDTPDLALNHAGVVVRARRIQGAGDDSVVKLRPVVPEKISKAVRKSPSFGIEVDAMPGGFVCSGSYKAAPLRTPVKDVLTGSAPIRKLFTKEQRAFYAEHAPEGISLDGLTVLGPITLLKLKFVPPELPRKMVAELWFYPDGSRILELSTKCLPNDGFAVAAQTRVYLTERGVDLTGEQQTKTRTALEYFSGLQQPA